MMTLYCSAKTHHLTSHTIVMQKRKIPKTKTRLLQLKFHKATSLSLRNTNTHKGKPQGTNSIINQLHWLPIIS